MSVRIRMKKMGRRHRPFFRICAMDKRAPRDGKVIEELGHYDPMVPETDARAVLKAERIDYWLGVGAQPSRKVKVLIQKYGSDGTHLQQQQEAIERLAVGPRAPEPVAVPLPRDEPPAAEPETAPEEENVSVSESTSEAPSEESASEEAASEESPSAAAEQEESSEEAKQPSE